jgi:hypothetical protein
MDAAVAPCEARAASNEGTAAGRRNGRRRQTRPEGCRVSGDRGKGGAMKKALWWVGGFCAAAAGFLVLGARRVPPVPVEALAREIDEIEMEEAWKDNHTVV